MQNHERDKTIEKATENTYAFAWGAESCIFYI